MKIEIKTGDKLVFTGRLWGLYITGVVLALIGLLLTVIYFLSSADDRVWWLLLLGLALITSGIVIFLLGGTRRMVFDRETNQIIVKTDRMIKSSKKAFVLSNASSITQHIDVSRGGSSSGGRNQVPRVTYSYYLQFSDGQRLFLDRNSRQSGVVSMVSGNRSTIPAPVSELSQFLNIKIEEDSLGKTMATASTVGGVVGGFLNRK